MTYSTREVKQLNIKEILSRITEYDIFKYYIKDFKMGTICSPLRQDSRPSFDIYPSKSTVRKIMFKDHADGSTGSCFDLVMRMYGLSFMQALALVDSDFNLGLSDKPAPAKKTMGHIGGKSGVNVDSLEAGASIQVVRRAWSKVIDGPYWIPFGITVKTLRKYRVSPVVAVKLNRNWFRFKPTQQVYCYHFKDYSYKILQPDNVENKWLTNATGDIIQGWDQLPETGDLVIITKSLKDVMVYDELGIAACAPQAEGIIPSKEKILELKERFKVVVSNYDYDRRGKVSANKMRKLYGIVPYMFTNDFNEKDASDFVKANGQEALKQLIWNIQKNS